MRFPRPLLSAVAALGLSVTHAAAVETETFVISNFDGYGVDQCLADGRPCGQAAAAAWCHSRDYQTVVDFGRLDRTNSTSARPIAQPAPRLPPIARAAPAAISSPSSARADAPPVVPGKRRKPRDPGPFAARRAQ